MNDTCLMENICVPYKDGVEPLDLVTANILLKELDSGWQLNELGHLYKQYRFDDFMQPTKFANRIADLADKEAHHPDLTIAWGKCLVEIWTHKIDGLTENDFILAAKIEAIK